MKVLLAGSPQISILAFEKVIKNFEVVAMITQPDRPQGRGMKIVETPVAKLAKKHNIKIFKPKKISLIRDELEKIDFDILLTFAFGQWIPPFLLKQGKYKPVNIHGSLLPKYRGAAPIHYAILNGDKEIGITLIEMIKEMDAGDMYFKASQSIDENTTTGDGFKIISDLAAKHIVEWLKLIEQKKALSKSQGDNFSTSPKIEKSYGELNRGMTVEQTIRRVRGLNPFPCAFKIIDGKRMKIFNISTKEKANSIKIECCDGELFVIDYQKDSKKRVIL